MVQPRGMQGRNTVAWKVAQPPDGLAPDRVEIGNDPMALQVAVAEWNSPGEPTREAMRSLHAERQAKKLFPLVLLATRGDEAWVFGPAAEAQVVALRAGTAERLLQAALDEPSGLAARHRLAALQRAVASGQEAGVANRGLFAGHYLQTSVRERADWPAATEASVPLLGLRHEGLIKALGYTAHPAGQALLLSADAVSRAVAVLLEEGEQFDGTSERLGVSPVAYGLKEAARHDVPWLVMLRGSQIRLYPARPGVGVGQKGQVDTWFELDLAVVDESDVGLLALVFSAEALAPGGTTQQLLDGSAQFAVDLGERLRERVYLHVVPRLAKAIAAQLPALGKAVDAEGLDLAYRLTMRVLFRLLFQAYAEDRGLLPYGRNSAFDEHSLNRWAKELADDPDRAYDATSKTVWGRLAKVWKAIDGGKAAWDMPAYNGGLFGTDRTLHEEGHLLTRVALDDETMSKVLAALLVDSVDDGVGTGAVDFRSLSVREFGTIYEGLLESSLSVAPVGLVTDKSGTFVPAPKGSEPAIKKGEVYFHSASGQRKSTGTYFTPHIVVEHLVSRSLDPVLDQHLARVKELLDSHDQSGAAAMFFDFRVADLAMGSAHFLTAAVDHMESRMRDFLTEHPIARVTDELRTLETAATLALGTDAAAVADIDPAALLRRQIARRCIYGLDINPMAVELARLAIWITTFVPGLPMSSLDHTLVCANSLTGVGTVDEAVRALDPSAEEGQTSIFTDAINTELAKAKVLLVDAANASEATKADVTEAAEASRAAKKAADPARVLFDAVVAGRLGMLSPEAHISAESLAKAARDHDVAEAVAVVRPAHFPFLFPEVFLRDNPGFDVILGNPPWEELMVEEPKFWLPLRPGLLGLRPAELKKEIARLRRERPDKVAELEMLVDAVAHERAILLAGPYPGLGTGDIDLYQAFAWRFWLLCRLRGRIGVVIPRSLLNSAGGAKWRVTVIDAAGIDVTTMINTNGWLFPAVHGQYSIGAIAVTKGEPGHTVRLAGPAHSAKDFIRDSADPGELPVAMLRSASTGAAFPQLPSSAAAAVFTALRSHPRLDERSEVWDFRPVAEFHATNDRSIFDAGGHRAGRWPVYGGSAFNLWDPDTGEYYAWATPSVVTKTLQEKRERQARISSSAFYGLSSSESKSSATLPCRRPRIAFRDITNSTNKRTVIAALVPGDVVLTNKAPYLLRRGGTSAADEAYLLGCLSSVPLDWYARRFVEITLNLHIFNGFPVPRPGVSNPLRARVVQLSGQLAAVDERFLEWADEVGVPVGSVTSEAQKADMVAELDALVSLLYGLSEDQVEHIFETFHVGWAYQERLAAVKSHYRAWEDKA